MIDRIKVLPLSDGVVADVAFDEVERLLHFERSESKRLLWSQLGDNEIAVRQQQTVGTKN